MSKLIAPSGRKCKPSPLSKTVQLAPTDSCDAVVSTRLTTRASSHTTSTQNETPTSMRETNRRIYAGAHTSRMVDSWCIPEPHHMNSPKRQTGLNFKPCLDIESGKMEWERIQYGQRDLYHRCVDGGRDNIHGLDDDASDCDGEEDLEIYEQEEFVFKGNLYCDEEEDSEVYEEEAFVFKGKLYHIDDDKISDIEEEQSDELVILYALEEDVE
ncbi:uncharacterized protein LY89DRAFT_242724 [Mollisia scopiformis]|uniref:Uncharacterized protein n=1 Tax=Mollisia scopiformis TaxID=149040 RepID=A0A194WUQ6_MOLSC|nr:uncharacterized protein LY89DRAFT_242724 [Mollisia scopiformis]KUJ11347.1 hypothetical protein LY89DRAFT_242724 [Mollisia scopiformis]